MSRIGLSDASSRLFRLNERQRPQPTAASASTMTAIENFDGDLPPVDMEVADLVHGDERAPAHERRIEPIRSGRKSNPRRHGICRM